MKDDILKLYSEYHTVYGPYKRKDGRLHFILYDGIKRSALSYPKAVIEIHLGRKLVGNETVDHIDEDFNNNELQNLRVIPRSENVKRSVLRLKQVDGVCIWCGRTFTLSKGQIKESRRTDRLVSGPFCSKSCSGSYGKHIQSGNEPLDRTEYPAIYFKLNE